MNNATTTGWTPEPDGRGTIGLVWSCLATIFICVWSALHLNLPAESESTWDRTKRQMGYVAVGLLAPEWLCYLALCDLEATRKIKSRCPNWSLKQCFLLIMGGIRLRTDFGHGTQRIRVVNHMDLLKLCEDETVKWPEIKESSIDDRTQGDKLVKAIALLQIVWFFAQTLGRAIEGLAVTTLELFTVGNVGCAIITYLAWWNKPNGIRLPIVIEGVAPSWVRSWDSVGLGAGGAERKSVLASLLIGFSFGALHLVAWNFYFASTAERILWRISSIGVTIMSAIIPLYHFFSDFLDATKNNVSVLCLGLCFGLYGLFRLYMFVEMFVALRDVPVDVYKTVQWSQYFPVLG